MPYAIVDLLANHTATREGKDHVGVEGPEQTCFDTIDNVGFGDC